ncbi:cell division protein FtsX [Desulfococcus sp.]|uniref:cell division protein FtsX n=1 Tax=Desulfococcus sp. TaxID=2025834 RepID=UPI003593073A
MIYFAKKVIKDMKGNFFLNAVTLMAIVFSVLIFSAFSLFFVNAGALVNRWIEDARIMVYLQPDVSAAKISRLGERMAAVPDVRGVEFIPRDKALERFRAQLGKQASLLDGITDNPLPDAFEVLMGVRSWRWDHIETIALRIGALDGVAEVEYGQAWLGRIVNILNLFRLTIFGMGGLFFMAVIFFVANTIRLVLYSRREEIDIMRLVGASENFIRYPLYVQSLLLGAIGGVLGIGVLFELYRLLTANMSATMASAFFEMRFLPVEIILTILSGSMFVGWLGCYISLRKFLRS